MNWWSWIFSQQAGVHCSMPLEWMPPSGSLLQQNTQSRAKERALFSAAWVALDPGARAGLTSQVLTAISLAEPDQHRQGDNIKIGVPSQPQACFFTCNSCLCKYLSPNGIWRSTFYMVFLFPLGMPGTVKINKTKAVSLAGVWTHGVSPITTPCTVLYYLRELHQSKNIAGTNSDPRACKKILTEAEGLGCTTLAALSTNLSTTSRLRRPGTETFPIILWFQ